VRPDYYRAQPPAVAAQAISELQAGERQGVPAAETIKAVR
jgi:hypothetical protein